MKANSSGVGNRKEEAQKMLCQLDDLEGHYETVETDVFDHKSRNAALQNGGFTPPSGTIFEAIFQELKRKANGKRNRHQL